MNRTVQGILIIGIGLGFTAALYAISPTSAQEIGPVVSVPIMVVGVLKIMRIV